MSFTLGSKPLEMGVNLSPGADFISVIKNTTGNWEPGTVIELRFGETVWQATIAADEATWNVDKITVDALIDSKARKAQLFYVNGTVDALWAAGYVSVSA